MKSRQSSRKRAVSFLESSPLPKIQISKENDDPTSMKEQIPNTNSVLHQMKPAIPELRKIED